MRSPTPYGTPVTDPNLIAQLEAAPSTPVKTAPSSYGTPVTDPHLIAQLEGTQQPSLVNKIAQSPTVQFTLGAGDAIRNTMADALNLLPGVNISPVQTGNGTAYGIGKFAGNAGAFLGGGDILDAARAEAEALPAIGQAAQALGGSDFGATLARRALGSAGYGAITNPQDRGAGALEGAALSGASDVIPKAVGTLPSLTSFLRPQQYANSILNEMGGGQSLENNAKSLAQDIQNAYQARKGESNDLYNPIFSNLGSRSIYDGLSGNYSNLDPKIINSFDDKISGLHDDFTQNPTLNNAHALQSQLGTAIRKLQSSDARGNLSVADRNVLYRYQNARNALNGDIDNFLNTTSPQLASQYNLANQHYLDNVVPYIENSKIASIAKGDNTNPRNITSIFKNPGDNTQKIVNDLGEAGNNKILYSVLGKPQNYSNAQNLQKAATQLDNQGLASYVTPKMSQQFDTLTNRIKNRNIAQMGAGALLGGSIAHSLSGAMPLVELAGAGISGLSSPYVAQALRNRYPIAQIGANMKNLASNVYPHLQNTLISNLIKGGQ
jgi:hypothetical protein